MSRTETGDHPKSMIALELQSLETAESELVRADQREVAKTFLREFVYELYREISFKAKLAAALVIVGALAGVLYWGGSTLSRLRADDQRSLGLIADQGRRIKDHDGRLTRLTEVTEEQDRQVLDLMTANLGSLISNREVSDQLSLAPRLWGAYHGGVCMIAGSYILVDPVSLRPLRYPGIEMTEQERLLTTGSREQLSPSGNGRMFRMEFVGTGFHVGDGYVLTNNHVATQPWIADSQAQMVISISGAIPRVEKLLAYFPGRSRPLELKFIAGSEQDDTAVSRIVRKDLPADLAVLPLAPEATANKVGTKVVAMGYPSGPRRLLALLTPREGAIVEDQYGQSLELLLNHLAKQRLIKPLTLQGYITDLSAERIAFDAPTTEGSSGTPLFGESGTVVGITFAEFVGEPGSNLAIPIGRARRLLERSGWHEGTGSSERKDENRRGMPLSIDSGYLGRTFNFDATERVENAN
jgi:S1-C subfamily serine protease